MFTSRCVFFFFFFFSSRRRHTRYWRDWSSDVCSSDLRRAAGVLALAWERFGPEARRSGEWVEREPGWTELALIVFVLLYALQSLYSGDFEQAIKNLAFFYIPFMLLLKLLITVRWPPRAVIGSFGLATVLSIGFAGVGFVEYATKHLFLNQKLIESNQFE